MSMSETPSNLGPEVEEGTMLPEQEEATRLRERRTRILGKDGTMHSPTPYRLGTVTAENVRTEKGEVSREFLRGEARGHDIQLSKSTLKKGTEEVYEYYGLVDGREIDADAARQLYERYEELINYHEEEAVKKAVKAQTQFHEQVLADDKEKPDKAVIEELLRDEPENP